ncbi:hypothetical protein Taro_014687 [Colocasia esculenta]|uniref:non-specific serine/threonine protein kinase n=1 Tax=Colocasia esculenta TaxID=4460 RepID=A0A843UQU7_COLES|nr:hypothetical protein [Colocasia esculenta]
MSADALLLCSQLLGLLLLSPASAAVSFNFPNFSPSNTANITYQGDAAASMDAAIELTRNQTNSRGWAVYSHPVRLWDAATGNLTGFTTTFSFYVGTLGVQGLYPGDGLAFFLAPNGSALATGRHGGALGLFNDSAAVAPGRQIVAVEFDTYKNSRDPEGVHIGINVGSAVSNVTAPWAMFGRWQNSSVRATISYDAHAIRLIAHFSGDNGREQGLDYAVDLRRVLPEWVTVGFSASTGANIEIHRILSWSFDSPMRQPTGSGNSTPEVPAAAPSAAPVFSRRDTNGVNVGLLAGLISGLGFLAAMSGLTWFILRQKKTIASTGRRGEGGAAAIHDGEISEARGPKMFPYRELARATRNFAPDMKLGRGGFGEVYKGFLRELGSDVAIKRVARDSRQGKKEYLAEVNIISRLRHRNLVQLAGWCHDGNDLLLVYEYLPHGSLDTHLFGKAPLIPWPTRCSIARGLASALLYLHEGYEQCVVHRDVKSSNVMLDADFNAKLGDFGLARLVAHGLDMHTTVPAGTWGYLAPECGIGGKAGKESDVYSFGVVALEIASGRKPIFPGHTIAEEEEVMTLVEWVWVLYGQQTLLDAADGRLGANFNAAEMERLLEVGLWCANPHPNLRPSMRQVAAALNFETSPPPLPARMPVINYGPIGSQTL